MDRSFRLRVSKNGGVGSFANVCKVGGDDLLDYPQYIQKVRGSGWLIDKLQLMKF
jgi:hypothetical protein